MKSKTDQVFSAERLKPLLNERPWQLCFPKDIEILFLERFRQSAIRQTRMASALGILLFMLFGVIDKWLIYTSLETVLIIRYVLIFPALLLVLWASFVKSLESWIEWLSLFGVGLVGVGVLAISVLSVSPFNYVYYLGMMLVVVFGATLMRMRFVMVMLLNSWMFFGLLVCIQYFSEPLMLTELGAVNEVVTPVLIVFWLSMASVASFNAYLFERFSRSQFIQSLLLQSEANELKQMGKKLHQLSITDGLTELANRRHFESFAQALCAKAAKQKQYLAAVMIDVDYFKLFNDFYGHQKGDEALQRVAAVLRHHSKRTGELAARYGGEEFVLFYYGQSEEQIMVIADSVRQSIELLGIKHEAREDINKVTVSVGVAVWLPTEGGDWEKIVNEADACLYQAKEQGRNRVVCQTKET